MATTPSRHHIAYFVTPHGYGHAARAVAVMEALLRRKPDLHFEVFTRVPVWFFRSGLGGSFTYHAVTTDVGLAQRTALSEDMPETIRRLGQLMPFDPTLVTTLAEALRRSGCRIVMCDIAPLGIAAARAAGSPCVLVENFTWDWIYAGYLDEDRRLSWYIDYLADLFAAVDFRIQTEPVARHHPRSLTTAPVSRARRTPAPVIRQQLGVPERAPMVLVTMGGFSWRYGFLKSLAVRPEVFFVVPGGEPPAASAARGNVICPPHHSRFFHPDLVDASDVVVGKVGYSTVAEVYWSGCAFGYVPRPRFRESGVLEDFVRRDMVGLPLSPAEFDTGEWLSQLDELLAMPRQARNGVNGAEQVAEFVSDLLAR
jgi:hypothetical protein